MGIFEGIVSAAVLLATFFARRIINSNRDRSRAELLDQIAESALSLLIMQNGGRLRAIALGANVLRQAVMKALLEYTTSPAVAERIAAQAIAKTFSADELNTLTKGAR